MKNGLKMAKKGLKKAQKWPKMAKKAQKWAQNGDFGKNPRTWTDFCRGPYILCPKLVQKNTFISRAAHPFFGVFGGFLDPPARGLSPHLINGPRMASEKLGKSGPEKRPFLVLSHT